MSFKKYLFFSDRQLATQYFKIYDSKNNNFLFVLERMLKSQCKMLPLRFGLLKRFIFMIGSVPQFDPSKDYYKMLEIQKSATEKDIKKAYYQLAKKYHPDVNPSMQSKFKEINQAYEILSDEKSRKDYDSMRSFGGNQSGNNNAYGSGNSQYGNMYGSQYRQQYENPYNANAYNNQQQRYREWQRQYQERARQQRQYQNNQNYRNYEYNYGRQNRGQQEDPNEIYNRFREQAERMREEQRKRYQQNYYRAQQEYEQMQEDYRRQMGRSTFIRFFLMGLGLYLITDAIGRRNRARYGYAVDQYGNILSYNQQNQYNPYVAVVTGQHSNSYNNYNNLNGNYSSQDKFRNF